MTLSRVARVTIRALRDFLLAFAKYFGLLQTHSYSPFPLVRAHLSIMR